MFRKPLRDNVWLALFEERHAEAIFATVDRHRESLRTWLPWVDLTTSPEPSLAFIRDALAQFAKNEGFSAGIFVDGELAGGIGTKTIDWTNRKVEIGYWLAPPYEGRGIMTDAVRALVEHAFEEWQLHRVYLHCATGNAKSCAVAERAGFRLDGVLRESQLLYGVYHDLNEYGLLVGQAVSPATPRADEPSAPLPNEK
ncbi:MAG: GNAT family N-acetyltransferase [Acidobacteriota bacterium]|nr:GNAT family N-acetyltransferase [Acidobacteriota bacterium]